MDNCVWIVLVLPLLLFCSVMCIFIRYYENKIECIERECMYKYMTNFVTKQPNRWKLTKDFEKYLKRDFFKFYFLDIDNFKKINDKFGHIQGDKVLFMIAESLSKLDKRIKLYHISGDEFCIVALCEPKDVEEIEKKITTFKLTVKLPLGESITEEICIKVSVGSSQFPLDGQDYDTIVRVADLDMYKHKSNSCCKNCKNRK
ncbi:MAG: GGDEF domain-containing protein [Clostridia bacterium]